jgi:hypothetical protein
MRISKSYLFWLFSAALWLGRAPAGGCDEPQAERRREVPVTTIAPADHPLQAPAPAASDVEIGWCAFYPAVDVGMNELPDSGATVLSVCAGGWSMAPAQGVYDFSALDQQIAYAEQHNLTLALINEINPLYTPAWLRRLVLDAGQAVGRPTQLAGDIPSITSPLFAAEQRRLVERTAEYLKQRDTTRRVRYYHPGAEWWFPLGERYADADVARFREWLRSRYGSVDRLNARWRATFADFATVPPPAIDMSGGGRGRPGLATVYTLSPASRHGSWSTAAATDPTAQPGPNTFAAVTPGKVYSASVRVKLEDLRGCGALIEIAWVGPKGGAPLVIDDSLPVRGDSDWQTIQVTARAPQGAGRAWILLKVLGIGTATFHDVQLIEADHHENLAPNPLWEIVDSQPTGWSFQNWGGGDGIHVARVPGAGPAGESCLQIAIEHANDSLESTYDTAAAVHDWSTFWYENAARYINSLAHQAKQFDPSRPTVTYLTMSWAYPSEWDETQRCAIAPEVVAQQGQSIDALGLQLCAADGDPFRITACLDLVRKYRKPLWVVDLVDFTSGVHIGYPALQRATQSAIQHGASGIIYCAWHIPSVLDYSFHPLMEQDDIRRMITDAKASARLLEGFEIQPTGALIQPILPASPHDSAGFKNDYRSFVGWYKLLERLQQTVDVVSLQELDSGAVALDDPHTYPWVLVPDCPCLSDASLSLLERYVAAGGRLITTDRLGQCDEIGRPRQSTISLSGRMIVPDLGRDLAGDPIRDTHAGNTPPLFLWNTDAPTAAAALATAREWIGPVLAHPDEKRPFEIVNPTPDVQVTQRFRPGCAALSLVHGGIAEISELRIRIHGNRAPQVAVYVDGEQHDCAVVPDNGAYQLTLPPFRSHCVVIAEW